MTHSQVFINKSAATRILQAKIDSVVIVKKIWFMANGSVGVSYRANQCSYSTILSSKLFLDDAIKVRKARVNSERYMIQTVEHGKRGSLPKQVSVKFSGKDAHIVFLVAGIGCDCEDYKRTARNEFGIHPMCAHLFATAKSLGFESVSSLVDRIVQ